jgi:2-keto-4-pentenoate hydratase/2-oxohepta-3-ene-1,7-dioic acid hydratase in catechol pathway
MKLVLFDEFRLGVLRGERVVDVSAAVDALGARRPQELVEALCDRWEELRPRLEEAAGGQEGMPLDRVRLRPPVPRPAQLVCLAGNYIEAGRPEPAPFNAFLKATTAIIGDGETVVLPDAPASVFHFEPELALVVRKRASHLTAAEAMEYVFGYTTFIDASARGLPGGFFLGKSWHTFAPLGPALVTADEIADPNRLSVRLTVNETVRQEYSTADMARPVPELLAEVTRVMALEPGDVVATGTHHEALTPIQGGDRVRVEVEGFGPPLTVAVRDPSSRTWPPSA